MVFFFNDTATTEIYTLSLHDALPIFDDACRAAFLSQEKLRVAGDARGKVGRQSERLVERVGVQGLRVRSEEHTSELQSRQYLVCRLLLEKKHIPKFNRLPWMIVEKVS